MKTGRPRKPTALIKLHGTFRHDQRPESEPMPDAKIPEMPKFLKGEAKAEWNRLAPLLAEMKCLTDWDRSTLAAYCFEWGVYVSLCSKLKKINEYVVTTINGNKIHNPLLSARNKALSNFKELATEFGLSPSSRTRLSVSEKKNENEFMKLFNRSKRVG